MPFTGSHPIRGHFSEEEEAFIKKAVMADAAPECPRCQRPLTSNLPKGGRCSRHDVWEFHCDNCLHSAVIEDDLN